MSLMLEEFYLLVVVQVFFFTEISSRVQESIPPQINIFLLIQRENSQSSILCIEEKILLLNENLVYRTKIWLRRDQPNI